MSDWFAKAIAQPYLFILCIVGFVIWRVGGKLGTRLFDEDHGIVPAFLRDIREDTKETKASIELAAKTQTHGLTELKVETVRALNGNRDAIERMERQLVNAIQAKPEDDELFRALFTENPIPICYVDGEGQFINANEAAAAFWSYSVGELLVKTIQEITDEPDIKGDVENMQALQAGIKSRYRMSKKYRTKHGRTVSADLYVFRYPERGAFLHFISIIVPRS
ncbi:MAG TPA: PAS domain S-box protein [Oceanipulchritudo sp.]|nr:PAS domain S-box protein [Oceanipulchritudo sp.]